MDKQELMAMAIRLANENVENGGGPMCLGAIYWAHLDRLYFACTKKDAADAGFDDDFIYKELDLKPADRRLNTTELMRDEAMGIFDSWRKKTDKVEY